MPQQTATPAETTKTQTLQREALMLWTFIFLGFVLAGLTVAWVWEMTRIPNHDLEWVYEREKLLEALRRITDDQ